MDINHDDLECWAARAMQELQDIVDDAQQATGDPDGESELKSVRILMAEYELIADGRNPWVPGVVYDSESGKPETLLDSL